MKINLEFRIEVFLQHSMAIVNFEDFESLAQCNGQKCLVVLINPHYSDDQPQQKAIALKEFRNPDAFEDIKQLIEEDREDIVHDTVSSKKYKCFFEKCRKSYFTVQLLLNH